MGRESAQIGAFFAAWQQVLSKRGWGSRNISFSACPCGGALLSAKTEPRSR
jgi:hypothetical protein